MVVEEDEFKPMPSRCPSTEACLLAHIRYVWREPITDPVSEQASPPTLAETRMAKQSAHVKHLKYNALGDWVTEALLF